ncbi:hypothetical protein PR048_005565 [Dryococelus australis]|uniref:Uncharacterized protein n=1 Tax=Dryococelus australis TaxID=614101 RepID=A0ABQ9I8K2_9NEOP|nr:hypothetical protein PR048_005565 [Dryococelus australis]
MRWEQEDTHTCREVSGRSRQTSKEAISTPRPSLHIIQELVTVAGYIPVSTNAISRWLTERDMSSRRPLRRTGSMADCGLAMSGVQRRTTNHGSVWIHKIVEFESGVVLASSVVLASLQRGFMEILLPCALPFLVQLDNPIFQQDNAQLHIARVSPAYIRDVNMLPWPPRSPDFSLFGNVWDRIGRQLLPAASTVDLEGYLRHLYGASTSDAISLSLAVHWNREQPNNRSAGFTAQESIDRPLEPAKRKYTVSYHVDILVLRARTDFTVPCVLLGDEVNPLKPYLMRSYPVSKIGPLEAIFDERLSQAPQVIECAFGIMCRTRKPKILKWRGESSHLASTKASRLNRTHAARMLDGDSLNPTKIGDSIIYKHPVGIHEGLTNLDLPPSPRKTNSLFRRREAGNDRQLALLVSLPLLPPAGTTDDLVHRGTSVKRTEGDGGYETKNDECLRCERMKGCELQQVKTTAHDAARRALAHCGVMRPALNLGVAE